MASIIASLVACPVCGTADNPGKEHKNCFHCGWRFKQEVVINADPQALQAELDAAKTAWGASEERRRREQSVAQKVRHAFWITLRRAAEPWPNYLMGVAVVVGLAFGGKVAWSFMAPHTLGENLVVIYWIVGAACAITYYRVVILVLIAARVTSLFLVPLPIPYAPRIGEALAVLPGFFTAFLPSAIQDKTDHGGAATRKAWVRITDGDWLLLAANVHTTVSRASITPEPMPPNWHPSSGLDPLRTTSPTGTLDWAAEPDPTKVPRFKFIEPDPTKVPEFKSLDSGLPSVEDSVPILPFYKTRPAPPPLSRRGVPFHKTRPDPLRDNDDETKTCREFTLEGQGHSIRWLCPF